MVSVMSLVLRALDIFSHMNLIKSVLVNCSRNVCVHCQKLTDESELSVTFDVIIGHLIIVHLKQVNTFCFTSQILTCEKNVKDIPPKIFHF